MDTGTSPGRRRSSLSQINVTPFVDVMLVLLIIFMVTAPMMEKGVDVNLPLVENAPNLDQLKEPVVITITADGAMMIGKNHLESLSQLTSVITEILKKKTGQTVLLEADRTVPYGTVMKVMAALRLGGVERLGMVAEEQLSQSDR